MDMSRIGHAIKCTKYLAQIQRKKAIMRGAVNTFLFEIFRICYFPTSYYLRSFTSPKILNTQPGCLCMESQLIKSPIYQLDSHTAKLYVIIKAHIPAKVHSTVVPMC